jgi:hypothetical protein
LTAKKVACFVTPPSQKYNNSLLYTEVCSTPETEYLFTQLPGIEEQPGQSSQLTLGRRAL